jgi:hypothetical protein
MDNIPSDVYTSYPSFGAPLSTVTKNLNTLTFGSRCNLMITKTEILNYLEKGNYKRFGNLTLTDKVYAYIHVKDPYLKNIVSSGASYTHYDTIYIKAPKYDGEGQKYTVNTLKNIVRNEKTNFVDIKTAYKIYSERKECTVINNYAKIKTKEYLDYIVDTFYDFKDRHVLYLYLLLNIIILKMDRIVEYFENDSARITINGYYDGNRVKYAAEIILQLYQKIDDF